MRTTTKGLGLLLVVASCWLLITALPVYQKLWFVDPSGNYAGGQWLTLALFILLFRRWHLARPLLLLFGGLNAVVMAFILSYNLRHGGHLLGFCLVLPLQLLALFILGYSTAVKQYLAAKPSGLVGRQSS